MEKKGHTTKEERLERTIVMPVAGLVLDTAEIRKTISCLLDTRENPGITEEYKQAFRTMDVDKLNYFHSMGERTGQQIMNVHKYRKGLVFGFGTVKFNEHGWLDAPKWNNVERSEIAQGNYVTVGRGNNTMWTYAVSFHYPSGGSSYALSVFGKACTSKAEARSLALRELSGHCHQLIGSRYTKEKDRGFAKALLRSIAQETRQVHQLDLF